MIYCLIQARLGSTRFKNKILQTVKGKTLLQYCYDRVKMSIVDDVYVICPDSDSELIHFCNNNKMNVMTGSENDVLSRYYECAKELKAEHIIRVTSDCPLICPELINDMIKLYLDSDYDFLCNNWLGSEMFPDGMDVEIMSYEVLEYLYLKARDKDREHVTTFLRKGKTGLIDNFLCENYVSRKDLSNIRLTLDYEDDYLVIKEIVESFKNEMFSMNDIVELVTNSLSLRKNIHKRNEGYYENR